MSKVVIYTKDGCPYCVAAKKHYTDSGIEFEEINVHLVANAQAEVVKLTGGQQIVPVIVDNGEVKIGFGGG